MRFCVLFFMLVFFLTSASVHGDPLTWSDCVRETLNANSELSIEKQALRKVDTEIGIGRSGYLPSVSLQGSYSQDLSNTNMPSVSSLGIFASQRLFPGLLNRPEEWKAQAHLEGENAHWQDTLAGVRLDLITAYAQLWFGQEWIKLAESISKRRDQNSALVYARYQAGREHKGSYLRAKIQADQAALDFQHSKRDVSVAQQTLLHIMGLPLDKAIEVASSSETVRLESPSEFHSLAKLTPAVREAQSAYQVALASYVLTESAYLPVLNASLSAAKTDPFTTGSSDIFGKISLSFPLFQGNRAPYDFESSKADIALSKLLIEQAYSQAYLNLNSRFVSAQEALELEHLQLSVVEAAQVRAEIARAQYNTGLLLFENWDVIESDLITQQKLKLARHRDAWIGLAQFEKTMGKGF